MILRQRGGRWAWAAWCAAMTAFLFVEPVFAQEAEAGTGGTVENGAEPLSGVEQPAPVALDPHAVFERVVVGEDGVARAAPGDKGAAAGAGERMIYSNTLGINAINFPTNQPTSDDIATTAANGCSLTRYRFKVLGKVLPTGTGGAYTVTYGLYTQCPLATGSTNAQRDLVRIPGTEGVITFPDDAPRLIEHIVPAQTPVALPTNVYLSLRFNRSNCGTVVGAPATVGYSGDIWDFPGFPCNGFLGGFPDLPHASFWAEFFGSDQCPDAFVAYKAERPSGGVAYLGANIQGVDDARLIVNNCQMIAYEVTVKGVGFYTFDLRRDCDGIVIPGTERTFMVSATTTPLLQVARFNFDPPIALATDNLYLGFKCSNNAAGAIVAGIKPIIGESGSDYFTITTPDGCVPVFPTTGVHGAVNLAITCAGTLPVGACCDPYLTHCVGGPDDGKRCPANALCVGGSADGDECSPSKPCASPGVCTPFCAPPGTCEAVCRETTEVNCPFPPRGLELRPTWQEDKACEKKCAGGSNINNACVSNVDCPGGQCNPFGNARCGVAACCHKTPHPDSPSVLIEVCDNLTRNECESAPPLNESREWQLGEYCGLGVQTCPHVDCIAREGSCHVAHDTPGCSDPFCCSEVCAHGAEGAFCCDTAWDSACVALAEYCCTLSPPTSDQCAPGYPEPCLVEGALTIPVPGSRPITNVKAHTTANEPGFCCNTGTGNCMGGTNDGAKCVVGSDCSSGVCTERVPEPWAQALGTVWLKFVQPAGLTTAGINTCASNSPALDSVVQVFRATDHSSQLAACNSLVPIGCNDDYPNCGSTQRNSRLCLRNLTPGETYYIELAAKTENRRGQYIVKITTSCTGETPPCTNCPVGEMAFVDPPSGVVDARRPHPPNHPEVAEGIQTMTAWGPFWATKDCWSVCQSPETPASVGVASVKEAPPGTYSVRLNRPVASGAVTVLTYTDKDGHQDAGRFIAHPANANGDGQATPADILALVDHINGVTPLPWGLNSGDIDRSGIIGPADILTLIELLNGANGFDKAWNLTPVPSGECP